MSSKKRTLLSENPPTPQSSDGEEDDDDREEEIQRTPVQTSDDDAADEEELVEEDATEDEEEEEEGAAEEKVEEDAAAEEEEDGGDSEQKSPSAVPESDGETESDSPSDTNKFTVKPIVKDDDDDSKKKKDAVSVSVSKPEKAKEGVDEEEGGKKSSFNRKWSVDDEIAVLNGMIDFKKIKNKDPSSNHDEFYKFVIKKINYVGFKQTQVMDKVRRLKKKFKGIITNSRETGKQLPNDMVFQLSQQIWGDLDFDSSNNYNYNNKSNKSKSSAAAAAKTTAGAVMGPSSGGENAVVNGNGVRKSSKRVRGGGGVENDEVVDFVKKAKRESNEMMSIDCPAAAAEKKTTTTAERLYPHLMGAFEEAHWPRVTLPGSFKSFLGMVDGSILEEWNQMWKEIQVAETEAYLHRIALVKKQTKCFLKTMKSSSSSS